MGRQERIYGSLIFCLFPDGKDGFWAAPFGQGQSSPQPSIPEHLPGSFPPDVIGSASAGWIWDAVPILDKFGDNTLVSTFFFSFLFWVPVSVFSFLTIHIVGTIVVFERFSRGILEWQPSACKVCVILLAYLPVLIFSLLSDCCFSFPSSSSWKGKFLPLPHLFPMTFDICVEYPEISDLFLFSFFWVYEHSVCTWKQNFFFLERGSIYFPQIFLGLCNSKMLRTTDV